MKNKKIILILLSLFIFLAPYIVFADGVNCTQPQCQPGQICDPLNLGNANQVQILIGRVISAVLGVVGSLSLVMFIYGGFTWMMSSGNKEKVEKGKNILVWATIGLVIIFSSYAIIRFLFADVLRLAA